MKICKTLFILTVLFIVTGCVTQPKIKEVVVYKTKDVYIPVPCDVVVSCEFTGDGYTPTTKLLRCVVKLKRALEYCKQIKELKK